ncbi:MAG TPA: hypothetical protein VGC09_06485 [Rhodopila sp.]
MRKFVTTATVLVMALGSAAYAGTPTQVSPSPASSMNTSQHPATNLTYSSTSTMVGGYAANPNVPGATGQAIVPGDHSTIAGDALATQMERTGGFSQ